MNTLEQSKKDSKTGNRQKTDEILERIQDYLYSSYAKKIKYARIGEVYDAVCSYIMSKLGEIWVRSKDNVQKKGIYILSFEYLPGRFIENKIKKLGLEEDLSLALEKIGYSLDDIINQEKEAALGIGKIGMGASYLIQELTNHKIKALAYGLRYENGSMKQEIHDGKQMEFGDHRLDRGSNREHQKGFFHIVSLENRLLKSHAFDIPVTSDDGTFINTMRLWKSAPLQKIDYGKFAQGDFTAAYGDYIEDSSLTQFLYVDDSSNQGKILRLKQELFYSVSCIQDIFRRYFNERTSIDNIENSLDIELCDIHPSLAIVEFIRILIDGYDVSIEDAIGISRKVFNHFCFSLTDDSKEKYDLSMVRGLDEGIYQVILDIDDFLRNEGKGQYIIEYDNVLFENISAFLTKTYYLLSKDIEGDFSYENKAYINMGIDRNLYSKMNNKGVYKVLEAYGIKSESYEEIKRVDKLRYNQDFINDLEWVKFERKRDLANIINYNYDILVNPYSIFDMQLEGFHESNRQILNALSIASLYYLLRQNSNLAISPITFIFSGKANSGYFMAKESLKFILALSEMLKKDRIIKDKLRIVFIEDMNVTRIKELLSAIDVRSSLDNPLYKNGDFDILASSFNFSNIVSSKGGILNNVDRQNKIYTFGSSYVDVKKMKAEGSYRAIDYYYRNELVNMTINNLLKEPYGNFPYDFKLIYDEIIRYNDSFLNFFDLEDLHQVRLKVAADYLDKDKWVQNEIDNLLWANEFNINSELDDLMNNL